MKFLIFVLLTTLHNQLATSQILRPPPYNLINRQLGERIIDTGNFVNPQVINEPPCNNLVPISNFASPSTTVITDCSPEICQNLANTIQLMIVCNLLQNSQSSDAGRLLAAPILNELMTIPGLSNNLISPNIISPNIIPPSIIGSPNIASNFAPNLITNYIPSNAVGPNFFTPNYVGPTPNIISPNFFLPPRIIAPPNQCPNGPQVGPADVNGLLNTLVGLLGNIRG